MAGKGICASDPNLSIADTLDHIGETKVTSATTHRDASTSRTAVAVTHAEHHNEVMHPSVEPGCYAPGAYTDTKSYGDGRQFTLPVASAGDKRKRGPDSSDDSTDTHKRHRNCTTVFDQADIDESTQADADAFSSVTARCIAMRMVR